jgi:hypothetical protein
MTVTSVLVIVISFISIILDVVVGCGGFRNSCKWWVKWFKKKFRATGGVSKKFFLENVNSLTKSEE